MLKSKFSTYITLDWDSTLERKIGIADAVDVFMWLSIIEKPIRATLKQSPMKGFHVTAEFDHLVDNWRLRKKWHDDGKRLVHEILQSEDGFKSQIGNEFFWDGTLVPIGGKKFLHFHETDIVSFDKKEGFTFYDKK